VRVRLCSIIEADWVRLDSINRTFDLVRLVTLDFTYHIGHMKSVTFASGFIVKSYSNESKVADRLKTLIPTKHKLIDGNIHIV